MISQLGTNGRAQTSGRLAEGERVDGVKIEAAAGQTHETGNIIGDTDASDGVDLSNDLGVLASDSADITLTGNRILRNAAEGILLQSSATSGTSTLNCLAGNSLGMNNTSGLITDFTSNWWGMEIAWPT